MPRPSIAVIAAATAFSLVAAACAGEGGREQSRATTTTSPAAAPSTAAAATTAPPEPAAAPGTPAPPSTAPAPPAPAPSPAPGRAPAPSCPPTPPRAAPREDRPRYTLRVDVKPAENAVDGEVAVRFTPDLPTDRLVFRLWPNGPRTARGGARLDVGSVQLEGRPAGAALESPTLLVVRPGRELPAGRPVEVVVPWRLTLPGSIDDRLSRTGEAIRLGSFFPILAWEPGYGWAVEPPTTGFAEASSAPAADFTATVSVPPGLDVLASGIRGADGRWTLDAAPDFALSVGRFTTATATARTPQPVQVTVGVHAGIAEAPTAYLGRVVASLEDFSRRFGAYPWPSYTLAITPNLGGGIEYPTHVFQGPGTMSRTTPHEVAHMWFYALVGNNQGRDPWLDEGLASWGEARFEGTLASFMSRQIPPAGRGRVGEPMSFWESRQSIYYRSVYVQGAQVVGALGPADLVDCALRVYVARTAYRLARPQDLLDAARAVFPGAGETFARFGVRP